MKWFLVLFTVGLALGCTDDEMMSEPVTQEVQKMPEVAKMKVEDTTQQVKEAAVQAASDVKEAVAPAPTPASNGEQMYVTPSLLNVRSGPGMSSSIVRKAKFQEKVMVTSQSRGWAQIGDGEYVASRFLSTSMPSSVNDPVSSPVVEEVIEEVIIETVAPESAQ